MRALPQRDGTCPRLQQKGTDRPPSGAQGNPVAPLEVHSGKPVHELRSFDHPQSMEGPLRFRKAGSHSGGRGAKHAHREVE